MERSLVNKLIKMAAEGVVQVDMAKVNELVAGQVEIANDTKQIPRERSRAAETVQRYIRLNVDVALKMVDKITPDQHEHSGTISHDHRVTAKELLDTPDYVEWLRQRERDSDPRLIRANGHEGNGKSVDDGEPRNGHRS